MRIYLDHNAGSPLRPEAVTAMRRLLDEHDGNPSSVHHSGQRARRSLEHARAQVAALIDASTREIVFTSGGTESNNLAIQGAVWAAGSRRRIVTSSIEHSSVLAPIANLESHGYEVVRLTPNRDGQLDSARALDAINAETAIVSLGLVNSETGAIQDLAQIADVATRAGAVFHVDAAQAAGRIDLRGWACDLMTLSGHKLGAPAGIGALFVRAGTRLEPILLGGPHESGLRAGTENLLGAVAFGAAAEASRIALTSETARLRSLSVALLGRLVAAIEGLRLNAAADSRVANTLNLTFPRVLGESLLIALDLEGLEVSMGSACAAGAVEASHVLIAMSRSEAEALSSLRISLGWSTTREEIDAASEIIPRVWRRVVEAEPARSSPDAAIREALR